MEYQEIQNIAKKTIEYIKDIIRPGMSLVDIRKLAEEYMLMLGADSFWYWDIGAFIFANDKTVISISGKNYQTSNYIIQENDIITIDLSPQKDHIWGDFARTIIIEDSKVINDIKDIKNIEWQKGMQMEELLHQELLNFVRIDTTFDELYKHMNKLIKDKSFINLDFLGNLGHSIEMISDKRIYIEKDNHKRLSDVKYFTFEPHIASSSMKYGFKKENIYYFKDDILQEL